MKRLSIMLSGFAFLATVAVPVANAGLIGPSPYLEFADSPFSGGSFDYFYLEDFEDHLFNTPGVSASAGFVTSTSFSGAIIDSVDGDDGNPNNGSCSGCDSYYGSGATGIIFTFDASVLGSLPTSVGIVWTDGAGTINFEAFGSGGASLGTLAGTHADGSYYGTTAEDRFYGVVDATGISSIFISNTTGGIEVDHLQYGGARAGGGGSGNIPEPSTLALMGLGLAGFGFGRKIQA